MVYSSFCCHVLTVVVVAGEHRPTRCSRVVDVLAAGKLYVGVHHAVHHPSNENLLQRRSAPQMIDHD